MVTEFKLRSEDRVYVLPRGDLLLGRDPVCDIVIDDDLVSRRHARFVVEDDTVTLVDLGSSNGTQVNGETVRGEVLLKPGDRIRIACVALELLAVPRVDVPQPTLRFTFCAACSSVVTDGMDFCVHCGRRVPTGPKGRTCPACRRPTSDADRFCAACGEPLDPTPPPPAPTRTRRPA